MNSKGADGPGDPPRATLLAPSVLASAPPARPARPAGRDRGATALPGGPWNAPEGPRTSTARQHWPEAQAASKVAWCDSRATRPCPAATRHAGSAGLPPEGPRTRSTPTNGCGCGPERTEVHSGTSLLLNHQGRPASCSVRTLKRVEQIRRARRASHTPREPPHRTARADPISYGLFRALKRWLASVNRQSATDGLTTARALVRRSARTHRGRLSPAGLYAAAYRAPSSMGGAFRHPVRAKRPTAAAEHHRPLPSPRSA